MGLALARQGARRGASVTIVAANVALPAPSEARVIKADTAAELARACADEFDSCDVLLMTAAVADLRPTSPAAQKLKKTEMPSHPTLELEPTDDVLSALASRRRPSQVIVGFAAEHGEGAVDYGRGKLARKQLDAIVVNDISQPGIGFDAADNEVTIITADGHERKIAKASKDSVAGAVLDEVERIRRAREGADGAVGAGTRSTAGV